MRLRGGGDEVGIQRQSSTASTGVSDAFADLSLRQFVLCSFIRPNGARCARMCREGICFQHVRMDVAQTGVQCELSYSMKVFAETRAGL